MSLCIIIIRAGANENTYEQPSDLGIYIKKLFYSIIGFYMKIIVNFINF